MRWFDTASDDFGISPDVQSHSTISYVNESGVSEVIAEEAYRQADISSAINKWMQEVSGNGKQENTGNGNMFFRSRYQLNTNVFDQMLQCQDAVEYDEILSNLADVTESLAFNRMSFECIDQDQEDVWNQIAADLDLDSRLREMWRELYKVSQTYIAIEWGQKVYTVRTPATDQLPEPKSNMPPQFIGQQNKMKAAAGQDANTMNEMPPEDEEFEDPNGESEDPLDKPKQKRKRRKQFAIYVPTALSILDPTKVMPVGQLLFGKERFAYLASGNEHAAFYDIFDGKTQDPQVQNLLDGPYTPTSEELAAMGCKKGDVSAGRLWLFKPDVVFRHTLTRASYERFASIRLKSVLPLLDMKAHLRASDRATLIGSTNFIVVLKRGSDKWPARKGEVDQLREQARTVARMPILIGDHRLSVEIVTPNSDNTLNQERYDTLDERIVLRALGTFRPGGRQAGASSKAEEDIKVVARGIESRRHEISRTIEKDLLKATVEKNTTALTETPSLVFHPRRVTLSQTDGFINAVLKLRDRGDISRETMLDELDYDQDTEFMRRRREKERYDSAFKSSVPHSSPLANPFMPGGGANALAPGGQPGVPGGPDGQSSPNNGRPPGAATSPDKVPK